MSLEGNFDTRKMDVEKVRLFVNVELSSILSFFAYCSTSKECESQAHNCKKLTHDLCLDGDFDTTRVMLIID